MTKSQVPLHGSAHLSKTGQELLSGSSARFDRWQVERVVDPLLQVAVGKEVKPEQRRQIREQPARFGEVMREAQKQQGDQSCPDLNPQEKEAWEH